MLEHPYQMRIAVTCPMSRKVLPQNKQYLGRSAVTLATCLHGWLANDFVHSSADLWRKLATIPSQHAAATADTVGIQVPPQGLLGCRVPLAGVHKACPCMHAQGVAVEHCLEVQAHKQANKQKAA